MKTGLITLVAFIICLVQLQAQIMVPDNNQQLSNRNTISTSVNSNQVGVNSGQVLTNSENQEIEDEPLKEEMQFSLFLASPNPAKGYTLIPYSIPNEILTAQIVLRNLLGSIVKTETIHSGTEKVRIDTSSLNNGIYIYSLVINNQPVESKRLVVSN